MQRVMLEEALMWEPLPAEPLGAGQRRTAWSLEDRGLGFVDRSRFALNDEGSKEARRVSTMVD